MEVRNIPCTSRDRVREAAAAGIIRAFKVKSDDNLADVLTKVMPAEEKRNGMLDQFVH